MLWFGFLIWLLSGANLYAFDAGIQLEKKDFFRGENSYQITQNFLASERLNTLPSDAEVPVRKNEENRDKEEQKRTDELDPNDKSHENFFHSDWFQGTSIYIKANATLFSSLHLKRGNRKQITLIKLYHQWKIDLE
jgi:hypothetical protein